MRAPFEKRQSLENPQYTLNSSVISELLSGGPPGLAGVSMHEKEAPRQTAVYRAIALLAGLIGYIPLKTYVPDPVGRARRDISDDVNLIREPYPDMTGYEWREVMAWNYFLWGNAYALKIRDQLGRRVLRLLPLPPSDITVERRKARPGEPDNPSEKWFRSSSMQFDGYTPYEILHIPGPGYDGLVGLSPIQMAKQALSIGKAAETYGASLFGKGTLQGYQLSTEQELEEEDATAYQRRWQEKVAGIARAHELLVLDKGAKLERLTLPPGDAQFIESREFSVLDVARLFGIPPHLLMATGATSNWGTGVEVHALQMLTFTLQPHLTRWEQRLTAHGRPAAVGAAGSGPGWLEDATAWHEFLADALLRIDSRTRHESYSKGIRSGWFTRADAREKENLPAIPGLELPLQEVNTIEVGGLGPMKDRVVMAKTLIDAGFDKEDVLAKLQLPGFKVSEAQSAPQPDADQVPGGEEDDPDDEAPAGDG